MLERKFNIYRKYIVLIFLATFLSVIFSFFFDASSIVNAQEKLSLANQNPLCQQVNYQELANKLRPTLNAIVIETRSPIIPDGEILDVKIPNFAKEDNVFCARLQEKSIGILTAKNSTEGKIILTIKTPNIGWKIFFINTNFELVSIPFDRNTGQYLLSSPDFYVSQDIRISSWSCSFIGSIALLIAFYLVAAIPLYHLKISISKSNSEDVDLNQVSQKGLQEKIKNFLFQVLRCLKQALTYLDLVAFTSDKSGKANISSLQITWFTLVVFGLQIHVLLRTGQLSAISEDILWLLGISGTSSITSTLIDVSKNKLSLENFSWLHTQEWLVEAKQTKSANWKDLINTNGSFDVYKYQLLLFSFVVGITLSVSGLNVLTEFKLPQGFLSLIGLSNVVYIFGNTISPNSIAELNKNVDDLRILEKEYSSKHNDYIIKARNVAGMLTLIYGKESTKFQTGIEDFLLQPKPLAQNISNDK